MNYLFMFREMVWRTLVHTECGVGSLDGGVPSQNSYNHNEGRVFLSYTARLLIEFLLGLKERLLLSSVHKVVRYLAVLIDEIPRCMNDLTGSLPAHLFQPRCLRRT